MNKVNQVHVAALVRKASLNMAARFMEVGPPNENSRIITFAGELLAYYCVMAGRLTHAFYRIDGHSHINNFYDKLRNTLRFGLNSKIDESINSLKVEDLLENIVSKLTHEDYFNDVFWAYWAADLEALSISANYLERLSSVGLDLPSDDKTDVARFAAVVRITRLIHPDATVMPPGELFRNCENILNEDENHFGEVMNIILNNPVDVEQESLFESPTTSENASVNGEAAKNKAFENDVSEYGFLLRFEQIVKTKHYESIDNIPDKVVDKGRFKYCKTTSSINEIQPFVFSKHEVVCLSTPLSSNCDYKQFMAFRLEPNQGIGRGEQVISEGLPREGEQSFRWVFPDGSSTTTADYQQAIYVPYNNVWEHQKLKWVSSRSTLIEIQQDYENAKHQQDWKSCVFLGQKSVDLFPRNSWGWIFRSFALHCLSRTKSAFFGLEPAAKVFPGEIFVFYNLSCYAAQLGNPQPSIDNLKIALKLAAKEGGDTYKKVRQMALNDADLSPIREVIPKIALSSRIAGFF